MTVGIISVLFFLALFLPAAFAEDMPLAPLPGVKTIENYLNGVVTLRAHFTQTADDGKQVSGTFLLKRPGRMRFDYAPPLTDFIVADGMFVYYYDGQMKQQSNTLISQSLADFFLRKDLRLSGDIRVTDIRRTRGLLQVTLVQSKSAAAGSLALLFGEHPLQLKKWRVTDAQGLMTEVALSRIETGIALDSDQFHYYDPARKNHLYNKN
jgi:outer membrane lipoprotein-sorting protein